MSDPDPQAFLHDARAAVAEIVHFTKELDRGAFASSRASQLIVERLFITLGEALSRFEKTSPARAARIPDIRSIVGMRHILVHNYRRVDADVLWDAIQLEIGKLDDVLGALLSAEP